MVKYKRDRFTSDYSVEHAIQRFQERYNYTLTHKELSELVSIARSKVQAGEYRNKEKNTNQYVLDLDFTNSVTKNLFKVLATFDTKRDTITTFLPYIPPVTH